MIISRYDADLLSGASGIALSPINDLGTGAGWARVPPGQRS